MKMISTIFLQAVVVLLGAFALGLLLWVPPHEGRNAGAALFAVYFKDPFLAYAYIGSIPFFTALYRAFKVLGDIGRGEIFQPRTVRALKAIRYCALANAGIVAGAVVYARANAGGDDPAGFVMPGLAAVFASLAAAAGAAVFEKIIQCAMEIRAGKQA